MPMLTVIELFGYLILFVILSPFIFAFLALGLTAVGLVFGIIWGLLAFLWDLR